MTGAAAATGLATGALASTCFTISFVAFFCSFSSLVCSGLVDVLGCLTAFDAFGVLGVGLTCFGALGVVDLAGLAAFCCGAAAVGLLVAYVLVAADLVDFLSLALSLELGLALDLDFLLELLLDFGAFDEDFFFYAKDSPTTILAILSDKSIVSAST